MTLTRLICAALIALIAALPAQAATILRDPDIEHGLYKLAAPVLRAAGLSPDRVKIRLIQDRSMNAFVTDGSAIYIHSGLINRLETPEQLQAVIAHEAAHIANGHITRRMVNARNAQSAALAGMALAAAVALSGGSTKAAGGIAAGASGSAMRNFMAHTRAEESAADQSSVRFMVNAGIDPMGAVEVQDMFKGQEALSVNRQDAYNRTHPLTRDRLRTITALAQSAPHPATDSSAAYWFARVRGKLSAFTQSPTRTLRQAKGSDDVSVMRRAIAEHRKPNPARAIQTMQALVKARPNDPFYYELYGQILLENQKPQAAAQAYAHAAQLAPKNAQILAGHGRALLAIKGQEPAALRILEKARARDGYDTRMLRDLARAYAATGHGAQASLATAERYALMGRMKDAQLHAKRAANALPRGSTSWQRAQDVLAAAQALAGDKKP